MVGMCSMGQARTMQVASVAAPQIRLVRSAPCAVLAAKRSPVRGLASLPAQGRQPRITARAAAPGQSAAQEQPKESGGYMGLFRPFSDPESNKKLIALCTGTNAVGVCDWIEDRVLMVGRYAFPG